MTRLCSLRLPSAPNRSPDRVRCTGRFCLPAENVRTIKYVSRIKYHFCDTEQFGLCKHLLIPSVSFGNILVFDVLAGVASDINAFTISLSWPTQTMLQMGIYSSE